MSPRHLRPHANNSSQGTLVHAEKSSSCKILMSSEARLYTVPCSMLPHSFHVSCTASGQQGLPADLRVRRAQTMSRPRLAYITHIARGDSTASSAAEIRRMRSTLSPAHRLACRLSALSTADKLVQEGRETWIDKVPETLPVVGMYLGSQILEAMQLACMRLQESSVWVASSKGLGF